MFWSLIQHPDDTALCTETEMAKYHAGREGGSAQVTLTGVSVRPPIFFFSSPHMLLLMSTSSSFILPLHLPSWLASIFFNPFFITSPLNLFYCLHLVRSRTNNAGGSSLSAPFPVSNTLSDSLSSISTDYSPVTVVN